MKKSSSDRSASTVSISTVNPKSMKLFAREQMLGGRVQRAGYGKPTESP
jgi:hypothetical protein